jgi:hypothetical protein
MAFPSWELNYEPSVAQAIARRYADRAISFFFFNLCGGTLGTAATTGLFYQPRMIGDVDCGEIGGITTWEWKPK